MYHLHTCALPVSPPDCDFVSGKRLFEPTEDSSDHEEIVTRTDPGIGGHISPSWSKVVFQFHAVFGKMVKIIGFDPLWQERIQDLVKERTPDSEAESCWQSRSELHKRGELFTVRVLYTPQECKPCATVAICWWGECLPRGVSTWGCLVGCVFPGLVFAGGVCPGDVCPGGVCVPQHALRQTPLPPPVDRILDTRLWKYYLATTLLQTVNIHSSTF